MGVLDDYMGQVGQYDAGRPNTQKKLPAFNDTDKNLFGDIIKPRLKSMFKNSAISVPGMDKTPAPGGNYDETGWRGAPRNSVGTTTPNLGLSSGDSQKVINDRSASGMERFDPKKLTLGNTPSGKIGLFKGNEMLDVAGAQKQLGINKAPGTFTGKVNTDKASGMIDFTKQFAQDDKIFKMRMQNAQTDPKFFTGPGEPGAGTYGPNSEASAFRSRRDALAAQVDDYNRKNPITSGMSVGDIVSNAMATAQARKEIKHIDEQIFGRTELANKIMTALIGKDSALGAQALENEGKVATQRLENVGIMDARRLMETGETLRNMESIVAGRYAGKGNEDLEKKKSKLDLLKSLGIEGYKGKIAAGDYDGASKFATDFMTKHFGDDDELKAIFK